jgi:hypothetical protein
MSWRRGWLCGGPSLRRLASGGLVAVLVPLLLFAPSGAASAEQVTPAGAVSQQIRSQDSTGVVPDVVGWSAVNPAAGNTIRAAGFVVQTQPGWVDCGPGRVQAQWPVGGASAPLGSTVVLTISQRPRPPDPCP